MVLYATTWMKIISATALTSTRVKTAPYSKTNAKTGTVKVRILNVNNLYTLRQNKSIVRSLKSIFPNNLHHSHLINKWLAVLDSCRIRIPSNTSSSGYKTQYSSICGDNGRCVEDGSGADEYKCQCDQGYSGDHCQIS